MAGGNAAKVARLEGLNRVYSSGERHGTERISDLKDLERGAFRYSGDGQIR